MARDEEKEYCGPDAVDWKHSWLSIELVGREKDEEADVMSCKRCGRAEIRLTIRNTRYRYESDETATIVLNPGRGPA